MYSRHLHCHTMVEERHEYRAILLPEHTDSVALLAAFDVTPDRCCSHHRQEKCSRFAEKASCKSGAEYKYHRKGNRALRSSTLKATGVQEVGKGTLQAETSLGQRQQPG
jgi:hypothetical protein